MCNRRHRTHPLAREGKQQTYLEELKLIKPRAGCRNPRTVWAALTDCTLLNEWVVNHWLETSNQRLRQKRSLNSKCYMVLCKKAQPTCLRWAWVFVLTSWKNCLWSSSLVIIDSFCYTVHQVLSCLKNRCSAIAIESWGNTAIEKFCLLTILETLETLVLIFFWWLFLLVS